MATGSVAPVAVAVLMERGARDPVPTLNVPALLHQTQHCVLGAGQPREAQVGCLKGRESRGPPMAFAGGVAGLAHHDSESRRIESDLGNVDPVGRRRKADPPPAVDSIKPLKVLRSHTSCSRSPVPEGIWATAQSRITQQRAATVHLQKP